MTKQKQPSIYLPHMEFEIGRCPNCQSLWNMHSVRELEKCRKRLGYI